MDNLCNIQQLKECFGQQTKFYVLDISKASKLLGELEQNLENTIIWKSQPEINIQLKYTSMEVPIEYYRQEDNNFVFYHKSGEQDDSIKID